MKKLEPGFSQGWPLKGNGHKPKYIKSHLNVINPFSCEDSACGTNCDASGFEKALTILCLALR